jgi:hypothetical protein
MFDFDWVRVGSDVNLGNYIKEEGLLYFRSVYQVINHRSYEAHLGK